MGFQKLRRGFSTAPAAGLSATLATKGRVQLVASLLREPRLAQGHALAPLTATVESVSRGIDDPAQALYLLSASNGAAAGVLWCCERRQRRGWDCYVAEIALGAAHRGHGLGAELMHRLERAAASCGARCVNLDQMSSNPRAGAFYDRIGYRVVGYDVHCASGEEWIAERARFDPGRRPARAARPDELGAIAEWIYDRELTQSLDGHELTPGELLERLARAEREQAVRVLERGGRAQAVCWHEVRSNRAGYPIVVFLVLDGEQEAASARHGLLPLASSALFGCRGSGAHTAYFTLWGPRRDDKLSELAPLGPRIGRFKRQKALAPPP